MRSMRGSGETDFDLSCKQKQNKKKNKKKKTQRLTNKGSEDMWVV
jgi:hypothetical protein